MKRDVKDTHIYFPVKVLDGMRKLAERNRRTVSAEMVIAAERHIAAERPATNGTKGEGAR
jgi:hypothetical protein